MLQADSRALDALSAKIEELREKREQFNAPGLISLRGAVKEQR